MKRNLFLLGCLFIMTLGVGLGLTSCNSDDDPDPEIVTDNVAYYIAGEVLNNGKPLEGVKVNTTAAEATTGADGTFELELSGKGDYPVTFSKDGYVTVTSEVTIKSDAKNKASVLIKQELTKKRNPVTVKPNEDTDISDDEEGIDLLIPAGAVDKNTDITMTPFIPGANKITTGVISAGLMALNMDPDGLVFGKPVTLTLKNPMGKDVHFGNMKHVVETDGIRRELDNVTYDNENNYYKATLAGFSDHIFAININATAGGTSTESLSSKVIDNLGNSSAKSESVTVAQKYGWEMNGDVKGALKSKYPSLTDATVDALAANITKVVSSLMGSAPGTGNLNLTIPFNISGDTKLTVEFLAQIETDTFSFPLIFVDGGLEWFDVSAKRYMGTQVNTVYQYGGTHTDHSGGSGS
ncbi:MAG: carboxypeptidase-like regulatory domain-containing protein [Tannerella sp.]|jgi:hypothetical protein|nr:carboxypeptidase-like regulatory domain-containing protein [Tannerella sp.]